MVIRIVTDSTADLPEQLTNDYNIGVVPLNIHFGEEVLKDGVDIWSDEFYHRVKNESVFPNTSQPSPGEFMETYQKIARPGDTIISIHLSAQFSGTVGTAKIAAEMLKDDFRVIVIDSQSATMGLGLIVLEAARLAAEGSKLETIMEAIKRNRQELAVNFSVSSLEYLHRTGRIGKASAYLGSLLNIKPLLTLREGMIFPLEKVRGNTQKVVERMVEDLFVRFGTIPLHVGIVYGESPEYAEIVRKVAQSRLNIAWSQTVVAGPIIGSHTGPSVYGIVALPKR